MSTAHTHAIAMSGPHASTPTVLVRIDVGDNSGRSWDAAERIWGEPQSFWLWIPSLELWTLETVRLAFHELSAYIPPDSEALATLELRYRPRLGRKPRVPAPPVLDDVRFTITARGWRATMSTRRNERTIDQGGQQVWGHFPTGEWTEPMRAELERLAARGPYRLNDITRVISGSPFEARMKYASRLTEQLGIDPRPDLPQEEGDHLADTLRKLRKRLDNLGGTR